ncbi:MAG TPA: sigma-54 dependent transcriptional regulator [Cellvibrio sp.]|nr:sigma-54 dependent transcriptional regulator [Cellvibrio sp.]
MNRLNLIILNSNTDNSEIYQTLASIPLELCPINRATLSNNPETLAGGINLFLFDGKSLEDPFARRDLEHYFQDTSRHASLCMLLDAEILTAHADFFSHFQDFLIWPCSAKEIYARLLKCVQPENPIQEKESKLLQEFAGLQLSGQSPLFIKTISLIKRIAACHAPVLVQGETGTGKENAARAIHYLSARRDYPFIPVNCAAIPDELLESELFGHEKGTFTDAKNKQLGLVSLAEQGTLFLDEVDSLTPKAQAALLRFLQTQEYRPLGSKVTLQADVRIVAATNANLKLLAENKLFREDLYFRLNVLNLEMPALRHRLQDIPIIAAALLEKFASQYRTASKKIHPQSLHYLMQQPWTGNIRELENILLRHCLLSNETTLIIEDEMADQGGLCSNSEQLDNPGKGSQLNFQDAKAQAINHFEEHYLKELMAIADGNVSAAARIAGKERRALGKLLQKHHIQRNQLAY